jgi:hypothetical protein
LAVFFCVLLSICYGYEGNEAFDFGISTVFATYQPLIGYIDR